ncbi:MAG TPA: AMP-binding protein [Gemmatimonadales bacterium]|nr:AMP-binding protein [Gemmatimonadales bacterium]
MPESPISNTAFLLWSAAARYGERPAIVERGATVTYAELRNHAAAIATALRSAGVAPRDRVAVWLERGWEAAAAYFGALAAGAVVVVINETLRPRQVEHILSHSGAGHLVTTPDLLARQPRALSTRARVLDVSAMAATGSFDQMAGCGSHPAQLVYTSGSTGLPKGVVVSHANLRAVSDAVVSYLSLVSDDRIASLLPFSFVYGIGQLLCAVGSGAALVVERSALPQQMVETVRQENVTVLAAVPPLWTRLLRMPSFADGPLPSLRVTTNAGGHLPRGVVQAVRRAQPGSRLFLMYGLTEAIRCTYLPPEELDRRPNSIGRAIPGGEIRVLRDDGSEAAPGEVGELVYRGPTVTLGYWNDPELTARVFRSDAQGRRAVFSGDLVRRDEEGFLYFVGRRDRVIKTMGYRVGPDEIASVLYESGQVVDAVVLGEPDPERGERIVAHVVLTADGSLDRLRAYCGTELPRHLQPARLVIRDVLPLLPTGKHDMQALRV